MCLADNKVVEPSTEAQTDAVPTRLGNVSCEVKEIRDTSL